MLKVLTRQTILSAAMLSLLTAAGCAHREPINPLVSSTPSTEVQDKPDNPAPLPTPADLQGNPGGDCCTAAPADNGAGQVQADGRLLLTVHFEFAKFDLNAADQAALQKLAATLKGPGLPAKVVLIAGHADSRGSEAINLALSQKRAQAVLGFLKAQGVNTSNGKFEVQGLGEHAPVDPAENEAAWAQNRRAEIRLLP